MRKHKHENKIPEIESLLEDNISLSLASELLHIPMTSLKRICIAHGISLPRPELKVDRSNYPDSKQYKKTKKRLDDIIQKNTKTTNGSCKLKKQLIKFNYIEEKCIVCGLGNIWNNKSIQLQLDHIDGNPKNNLLINLRLLCPNCHSQTHTFSGKHIKKETNVIDYDLLELLITKHQPKTMHALLSMAGMRPTTSHYQMVHNHIAKRKIKTKFALKCTDCHRLIPANTKHGLCVKCVHKIHHRCEHPTKELLIEQLKTSNPYAIGKIYGVSDNAVRKWMESYGIPRKKKEWKEYVNQYEKVQKNV